MFLPENERVEMGEQGFDLVRKIYLVTGCQFNDRVI